MKTLLMKTPMIFFQSLCIVSYKNYSYFPFFIPSKPSKQWERYTISNTLRLSLYTSMNTFIDLKL